MTKSWKSFVGILYKASCLNLKKFLFFNPKIQNIIWSNFGFQYYVVFSLIFVTKQQIYFKIILKINESYFCEIDIHLTSKGMS